MMMTMVMLTAVIMMNMVSRIRISATLIVTIYASTLAKHVLEFRKHHTHTRITFRCIIMCLQLSVSLKS